MNSIFGVSFESIHPINSKTNNMKNKKLKIICFFIVSCKNQ
jgi:hypothetical protein